MSNHEKIIIGIDGGGTHTRVMVSDMNGHVLSYIENGSSSIKKDLLATQNVQQAITDAINQTEVEVDDVCGLVAGIAGLDSEEDYKWAEELTNVPGLVCPKWHVNDAVVAHNGAFLAQPGIVIISGTGSILFAITEEGRQIRNYDFHHYAASAARFLSYDAVFEILAGNITPSDESFILEVLDFWKLNDIHQLKEIAIDGFMQDRRERDRLFGEMGPLITTAANQGIPLARKVCDKALLSIVVGVEILASCFISHTIPIVYIGSVINSRYMKESLTNLLNQRQRKNYLITEPSLSAVAGAVLMARERVGMKADKRFVTNISKHSQSNFQ